MIKWIKRHRITLRAWAALTAISLIVLNLTGQAGRPIGYLVAIAIGVLTTIGLEIEDHRAGRSE